MLGRLRVHLAALVAVFLVVGAAGAAEGPVRIAVQYGIESLHPQGNSQGALVDYGVAETLTVAETDGRVVPWLAKAVESQDSKVWTVTLRDGVTFHNGAPVDAKAVAAALIENQKKNPEGNYFEKAEIAATGPLEVTITLPEPNAFLPATLAGRWYFPIYDTTKVPADAKDQPGLLKAGIYTGPFIPAEVPTTTEMRTKANPNYWAGKVAAPGTEILFIGDGETRVRAVEGGQADIALGAPASAALRFKGDGPVRFITNTNSALIAEVMITHVTEAPMNDVAVRRAIAYAIDYKTLANDVLNGAYAPAESLYGPTISDAKKNYVFDPKKAAELLDAAGWKLDGETRAKDGKKLQLTYLAGGDDSDAKNIGVALQQMLAEVGIALDVKSVDDVYAAESFPTWHLLVRPNATYGINGSPIDGLGYSIGKEWGLGGQDDVEVANLSHEATTTTDAAARSAVLAKLQDRVLDQGLLFALGFAPTKAVVKADWAKFLPYETPAIRWNIGQ